MDFIKKLLSSSGFDTILVIVDQLTKQIIFISAHNTIISSDLVYLFVLHIFSKYSISSYIISNRGLEFVSNFFHSLSTVLDMQLRFTLDYYPKGNRQTKCMNQTLKQYLHIYCNYQQDNQSELLSLLEFAYNNASSATTSVSPFFANKRYYQNITVYPECNIAFWLFFSSWPLLPFSPSEQYTQSSMSLPLLPDGLRAIAPSYVFSIFPIKVFAKTFLLYHHVFSYPF